MNEFFRKFSRRTADVVGSPWAFIVAIAVLVVWLGTGRLFHFSDTWQLVINTGTSVVTFLMVFVIQASQNRDSKALHLKLDELIRVIADARTDLVDLEERPESQLNELADEFRRIGADQVPGGSDDPNAQSPAPRNGAAHPGPPA